MDENYEKIVFVDTLGFQTNLFDNNEKVLLKTKTIYVKKPKERNKKDETTR